MRVGEGVPAGRYAKLYNSETFLEHEEVIVFTRDDINRTFTSIMAQIDDINKINLYLDKHEEWKLIGYWPKIMQNVHYIDTNMDLIFKKEPLQSYLDTNLYNEVQSSKKKVAVFEPMKAVRIGQTKLL